MTHLQQLYIDTPDRFGPGPKHSTVNQILWVVEFIHDGIYNSKLLVSSSFMSWKPLIQFVIWVHLQTAKTKKNYSLYAQFIFYYFHDKIFIVCYADIMPY